MKLFRSYPLAALSTVVVAVAITTCRDEHGPKPPTEPLNPTATATLAPPPPGSVVLVGAGDIASCTHHNDTSTAKLLDSIPGTVFTTGDNDAPAGDSTTYANCYNPTWGRQKARTYPAPGDLEYGTPGAAGYFGYFGSAAGDPTKGYYSYNLGAWHIIVLNSSSSAAVAAGSVQEQWLKADLAANPSQCTLAYWHYPLFYSGTSTVRSSMQPLWNDLYAAHADVVLNSHTRNYERFAPQTPAAVPDTVQGIREFVVGTGGLGTWSFYTIAPNSQVRAQVYGVLKFTLSPGSYRWQFIAIPGTQFSDTGSGRCHGVPPAGPFTPVVTHGNDRITRLGDTLRTAVTFSDPAPADAPWTYTLAWGDGAATSGTTASASAPITLTHVYSTVGVDSLRVAVTNAASLTGRDSLAVQVVAPSASVVLVGAGDIADCTNGSSLTATLLDGIPGTVFAGGDNAYPSGSSSDYATCYDPSWGRHKLRTRPVPGNHDYVTTGASGYYGYFGAAAGDPTKGYYSYDLGAWHIIVLNSNYTFVATAAGSAQEQWLKADLAATTKRCLLAMWHHPRFYSTTSPTVSASSSVKPFWDDLYAAHADVVVNGHMHDYERFAPVDPTGALDSARGIREIIAGAGGGGLDGPNTTFWPTSQVRISGVYGVLKFTLSDGSYSWQFVPVAGQTATDSGSTACHGAATPPPPPPAAAPGGPYAGTEGSAVSFDGSGSADPSGSTLTYAWTFGDGSTGTGVKPTHTYLSSGLDTVTLIVSNASGRASAPVTTTASIANVAPTVSTGATQAATPGSAFTLSLSASDPGSDAPWSYTISWGDGTALTTGSTTTLASPITATHTYAAAGTDTVRVTFTDKAGGVGATQAIVTVAALPPPTAAPGGPYAGREGTAVSFDGSASSDPAGAALTYAWSFGDGASGTGPKPTHTYASYGSYTVTLTVTSARGPSSAPATTTAAIANVAPTVNAGPALTVAVGSALTFTASFSDPGTDGPWSYAIAWGDGSPAATGTAVSPSSPITATHSYTAAGTDTVRLTVTDKGGASGTGQAPVTVTSGVAAVTLVGAGNIARCTNSNSQATAAILDTITGTVFALGDNAYPNGTLANYQTCYDVTWGRHKARTYPVPGHHDYDSSATAVGYFGYYGAVAGNPGQGYYGFDLGAWHIIVLNSNNAYVSTAAGSPQEQWLKSDLAANTKKCQLALFHHPRFYSTTSSTFYPTASVQPFWDDLSAAGAELIINAHMQDYERFAPQTTAGVADSVLGIREIIVGTGGAGLDGPNTNILPTSQARISGTYGVLRLTLSDGSYAWQFIPVGGGPTDAGTGSCH